MAARDRHRRPQLVRDVVKELLLPFEQPRAILRHRLGDTDRLLSPAGVPDHGEEHRGHERHLGQLAGQLRPAADVEHDHQPGRGADAGEDERRGHGTPDPEAVEQRQAHPDEVEGNRLPARPPDHGDDVGRRERDPEQVDRIGPTTRQQAGIPRGGRFRSSPTRASCAAAGRRRRRRSSLDRSGSPTRRRAAPPGC